MDDINLEAIRKLEEKLSAGAQVAGIYFQFWYFLYCLLDLRSGEKIGFEVKDDVHLELSNGKCILTQLKHTVRKNTDGKAINLTDLDEDLWKTISNWISLIKVSGREDKYIENHDFILATNKSVDNGSFPYLFISKNKDIDEIIQFAKKLEEKCKNEEIKKYINSFLLLDENILKIFIDKIRIECGIKDIIEKVMAKVEEESHFSENYLEIFNSLFTLVSMDNFVDISNRKKFTISFEEFNEKYSCCFRKVEYHGKLLLPDRSVELKYPEFLEKQKFIQQLIDINVIEVDDKIAMKDHTSVMLKFLNTLEYWMNKGLVFPTDILELDDANIYVWKTKFDMTYRQIKRKLSTGIDINSLDFEIKELACDIYDLILAEKIKISRFDELDQQLSNGYFYKLSDNLDVGWHYNWQERYKS